MSGYEWAQKYLTGDQRRSYLLRWEKICSVDYKTEDEIIIMDTDVTPEHPSGRIVLRKEDLYG